MREGSQKKVLIVDDEADICFLLSRILNRFNLEAGFANNLAEAQQKVHLDPPSLIFLDNSLPDGQGIDFIPYVKQHYPETRVIMVTANDSAIDRQRALRKGADEFIGKPLSLELINTALDRMKATN